MMRPKSFLLSIFVVAFTAFPLASFAQEDVQNSAQEVEQNIEQETEQELQKLAEQTEIEAENKAAQDLAIMNQAVALAENNRSSFKEGVQSLLFTYWEYVEIQEARSRIGEFTAEKSLAEESALSPTPVVEPQEPKIKPPPEERDISLGGILYVAEDEWTIWLNGQRITPQTLPPEAITLKVYGEYIEIKWLDDYSNKIIPIRLRPHQRFNIDTRLFLPG